MKADEMKIEDLPLPLRLRNALYKAGFSTDADVITWMNGPDADVPLRGVGSTGMLQLREWAAGATKAEPRGGPEVIRRRPERVEKPINGPDPDADASIYRRDDVATPGRWGRYTNGDTSMRGGLESLSERRDWADLALQQAERAAERAADPYWTPNKNHQWDAATSTAELSARAASMRHEAARLGAETAVSTSKDTLTLRLEHELQAQIGQMIPLIKGLAHVKELGVEVSRETVARMALIRGLDALERQYKGKSDAKTDENQPETAPDAPVSAAEPKNGVHPTPEGWTRVAAGEKIPVAQAVIHDYYTQNNWFRYWGKAGDSVIYFYWSPEVQFQDLDVFPGTDKTGKTVAVQDTPWGPGHIIPLNWANQ